ncbi:hypothetical protein DPEC_G00122220, partial [Dallia pectoralis]
MLEDKALVDKKDTTRRKWNKGPAGQRHTDVCHPVIERGDSQSVGEHTLQAHKKQPSREGHAGTNIVERLSMVHLPMEGNTLAIRSTHWNGKHTFNTKN